MFRKVLGSSVTRSNERSSASEETVDTEELTRWNEVEIAFSRLPFEIKLYIFAHLPIKTLGIICLVCREWRSFAEDGLLWRSKFEHDRLQWDVFSNTGSLPTVSRGLEKRETSTISTNWLTRVQKRLGNLFSDSSNVQASTNPSTSNELPSEGEAVSKSKDWKKLYLQCYFDNLFRVPRKEEGKGDSFEATTQLSQDAYKVTLFGETLAGDPIAKNLFYQLMWKPVLTKKGFFSGSGGVGAGVGFEVNGKLLNMTALHLGKYRSNKDDLLEGMSSDWKAFFKASDGLVFVMRNYYDISEMGNLLKGILDIANEGTSSQAPLLVFLCRGYLEDEKAQTSAAASETEDTSEEKEKEKEEERDVCPAVLAEQLGFTEIEGRKWSVRNVYLPSLDGIAEGLHWLTANFATVK
jgi:hypothetical protein